MPCYQLWQNAKLNSMWKPSSKRRKFSYTKRGSARFTKIIHSPVRIAFKKLIRENLAVNIDGKRPNHLQFADDVVLIAVRLDDAQRMLETLYDSCQQVGLNINFSKSQYMRNLVPGTYS